MAVGLFFDPIEGVYMTEGDGPLQTKKYLEMEDVRDIFMSNLHLDTGLLPKGCQYYLRQDGKTLVILEQEPRIRRILFRNHGTIREFDVPTPNTIFGLLFEGGTLRSSICAVSKFPITSMNTEVFRFPLGNVYQDSRICWGNAQIASIRNIAEASEIPSIFFEAPFNGDLSSDANSFSGHLDAFLSDLHGKEHFPFGTLVECQVKTLNDMINRLKRDAGF